MAHEAHDGFIEPAFKAASIIHPKMPVKLDTTADQVTLVAATTDEPLGMTGLATAAQGGRAVVYGPGNRVKAIAGASLGANANIGLASTNGALGPVAAASGVVRWRVGTSREAAAAGETFTVYVSPRQLSGLA